MEKVSQKKPPYGDFDEKYKKNFYEQLNIKMSKMN